VRIVGALELIQLEHGYGQRSVLPPRPRKLATEYLHPVRAVREIGHLIGQGLLAQVNDQVLARVGFALLRSQIRDEYRQPALVQRVITDRREVDVGPELGLVIAPDPARRPLAAHGFGELTVTGECAS
jgi:hypothetical protein